MKTDDRQKMKKGDKIVLYRDSTVEETFLIDGVVGFGGSCVCYSAFRGTKKGRLKEFYLYGNEFHLERMQDNQLRPNGRAMEVKFARYVANFENAYEQLEKIKATTVSGEKINNYVPPFEMYYGCVDEKKTTAYVFTPDDKVGVDFECFLKEVHRNRRNVDLKMYEILSVLLTLTDAINALHIEDFLHLDIKPGNFLIPYNSSYEINSNTISLFDLNSLHYIWSTTAPVVMGTEGYTAPEMKEIKEGKMPDDRADIYSIGCVLFHSIFFNEAGLYQDQFYNQLDTWIGTSRFLEESKSTRDIFFKHKLCAILKRCLATNRESRYSACEDLIEDLKQTKALLAPAAENRNLGEQRELTIIEKERTVDPYRALQHLLYRNPLYKWSSDTAEMKVLTVGTGNNGQSFIDVVLQAGQVANQKLQITAVSAEADIDRKIYLQFRPALQQFVKVNGYCKKKVPYGEVEFRKVSSFSEIEYENNYKLAKKFLKEENKYIFISLGNDDLNRAVAKAFVSVSKKEGYECAVNYVVYGVGQEVAGAEPVYLDGREETFHPELDRMAFLTHASWSGIREDVRALRKEFREKYNRRSSTAYALSIPYKLKSIGINEKDLQKAADKFTEAIRNKDLFQRITALEHRRWVLEKVTEGWTAPKIEEGAMAYIQCVEQKSVKNKLKKTHPCIVSSEEVAPLMAEPYLSNIDCVWECPNPLDADLDELDRMSIDLHRCFYQDTIKFRNGNPLEKGDFMVLKNMLTDMGTSVVKILQRYEDCLRGILYGNKAAAKALSGIEGNLIQSVPNPIAKDVEMRVKQIRRTFFSAIEYSLYRDYKQYDAVLTKQIPYILTYQPYPVVAMAFGDNCMKLQRKLQPKKLTLLQYICSQNEVEPFLQRAKDFVQESKRNVGRVEFLTVVEDDIKLDMTNIPIKVYSCIGELDGMQQLFKVLSKRKFDFYCGEDKLFSEITEMQWRQIIQEKFPGDTMYKKYWEEEPDYSKMPEKDLTEIEVDNMKEYIPRPAETDDIELTEDLLALREKIAENVHDVWAEGRMKEGWVYGKVKDPEKKTTPLLVPYDELPESEKEYDRNTAMETLKLVLKLGYDISKR